MTTSQEITYNLAHRKAVAFLKGILVSRAIACDHKYEPKRKPSPEFEKGLDFYMHGAPASMATAIHIIHNRLRHKRPHTESRERDDEIIKIYPLRGIIKMMEEVCGDTYENLEVK